MFDFARKSERRFIESARNTLIAASDGPEGQIVALPPSISSRGDKLLVVDFCPLLSYSTAKCESKRRIDEIFTLFVYLFSFFARSLNYCYSWLSYFKLSPRWTEPLLFPSIEGGDSRRTKGYVIRSSRHLESRYLESRFAEVRRFVKSKSRNVSRL